MVHDGQIQQLIDNATEIGYLVTFPFVFLFIEAGILLAFHRAGKLDFRYLLLMLASFFPQLILIRYTLVIDYSPDIFGHLDYLDRIVHSFALPDPKGWQFQQPPLYYYYLAVWFKVLEALGLYDPISPLRYFSHLLYVVYSVYAVRIVAEQKSLPSYMKWLCIVFLLFWPSIHFSAVRINTDTGFFLFYMMCFYYLQRWMREGVRDDLLRALLYASLSLLCKGTWVLSFATIGLAWCFSWKYGNPLPAIFSRPYRPLVLACLLVVASLSLYFGRVALYNATHEVPVKYFANVDESINVQTVSLRYYLSFDLKNYLDDIGFIEWAQRPFLNTFLTAQLYNYFLQVPYPWVKHVLAFCYLVIFCVGIAGVMAVRPSKEAWAMIAGVICLMAGVIIQRSLTVDAHMAAGRYVFPILLFIIVGYSNIVHMLNQKRLRGIALLLLANAFVFIIVSICNWYRFYV